MFTIAHELGHAMHSYYSQATQPYIKSDYAIFVAEVASTVNEVMLLKYLVQTTEDIPTKKYLLTYYLDMFRTTVYRQTMFAEFEKKAHDYDMKGKPLTPDTLNSIYYRLNKQYYGPGVKHDALIKYEWGAHPAFLYGVLCVQIRDGAYKRRLHCARHIAGQEQLCRVQKVPVGRRARFAVRDT